MSNAILKEFCFEFIPLNQIGLSRVHFSNLRLFEPEYWSGLAEEVKMGDRMAVAGEMPEVDICEPSQGWPRVVEKMQINSSRSLQKVLRQL